MKKKYQISLFFLLLAAVVFFAFVPLERSQNDASVWMADLDDTRPLSSLAIPGTHDSGALYSIADVAGKCQSLSIEEQLKAGVRFFDIRLQLRGDRLAVVHSFVDQLTDFEEVLDEMAHFLRNHPTEFLLVSIKEDAAPRNPVQAFSDAVEDMLLRCSDILNPTQTLPETVSEARGKIHIISRYQNAQIGYPAYDGWQDNTSFVVGDLYVQDHYALDTISEKQQDIMNAAAAAADASCTLTLNYVSCYLTHGFPPSYAATPAKTLLPWLEDYLSEHPCTYGVIICDFMTSELCETIRRCNFQ